MKFFRRTILVFFTILFGISCSSTDQNKNIISETIQPNNIRKEIPLRKQSESFRNLKNTIEKYIPLESLEKGFDKEEIRIWFANSSNKEQLVILRNVRDKWTAELYSLIYNYDSITNKLISISKIVYPKMPKSGWKSFIRQLFALDISYLPDMEEFDNYQIGYDGKTVAIEIANETSYRSYSYWEANAYQNSIPEAKKVVLISELLEKELDFKRL